MAAPVFKIAPGVQSYDWGKIGSDSLVAQYAMECVPDFEVDENKPYAELWMGTHPTVPSRVSATSLLSDRLAAHPEFFGQGILDKFPQAEEGRLPFLFKVLSVRTALSIQAHPNKELAGKLFAERPNIYKDPNHKPEMAIALGDFKGFLNFLPLSDINTHLNTVPELASLVPEEAVVALANAVGADSATQKTALKAVFAHVMEAPADKVAEAVNSLVQRYEAGEQIAESEKPLVSLVHTLNTDFPSDVGVLCVFLLNVVELKAGQAAFLAADVPHAYISGDIIECMAESDNVVRAGLTPKLRDVDTLVNMLTYESGAVEQNIINPDVEFNRDPATKLYDPPIDEFSVLRVHLAKDEVTTHRPIHGPSIAIITNGEAVISWEREEDIIVTRGDVVFLAAGHEYKWQARKDTEAFRAYAEA